MLAGCVENIDQQPLHIDASTARADAGLNDATSTNSTTVDADRADAANDRDFWLCQPIECDSESSDIVYPAGPDFEPVRENLHTNVPFEKEGVEPEFAGTQFKPYSYAGTKQVGTAGWIINEPQDVGFTMAIFTTQELHETTTIDFTLLIDYEPAPVEWRVIAPDGESTELETTGPGLHFSFDESVEVVEAHIPYELFQETGYHEVAIVMNASGPRQMITESMVRMSIWNQQFQRPPHPCFVEQHATSMTNNERLVADFLSGPPVRPYIDGMDTEQLSEGITIQPRVELTVDYYVTGGTNNTYHAAVLPTLNGVPLEPSRFVITPPVEVSSERREAYLRSSVTFEAPEQPGEYDFMVAMVRNAYLPLIGADALYLDVPPAFATRGTKLRINVQE